MSSLRAFEGDQDASTKGREVVRAEGSRTDPNKAGENLLDAPAAPGSAAPAGGAQRQGIRADLKPS